MGKKGTRTERGLGILEACGEQGWEMQEGRCGSNRASVRNLNFILSVTETTGWSQAGE